MTLRGARLLAIAWALALGSLGAVLAGSRWQPVSSYATSLEARTPAQSHNALRAAEAVDGAEIAAGGEFSFNHTVGPWGRLRGYLRAPVSFGGEMVYDYGGGVCQTSSALYNAALLAGLEVVERDHHVWQPDYVPPGRDAAVAQGVADLRLRNPWPWPVRLTATAAGGELVVGIQAPRRLPARYTLQTQVLSASGAPPVVRYQRGGERGQRQVRAGRPGARVATWRCRWQGGRLVAREKLSEDSYLPLGDLVRIKLPAATQVAP